MPSDIGKVNLLFSRYKRILNLSLSFFILWLSLGSLVNFHQHHIWKRLLIPQVVASLKQKDKQKGLASDAFAPQDHSDSAPCGCFFSQAEKTTLLPCTEISYSNTEAVATLTDFFGPSNLRAPPVA